MERPSDPKKRGEEKLKIKFAAKREIFKIGLAMPFPFIGCWVGDLLASQREIKILVPALWNYTGHWNSKLGTLGGYIADKQPN